MHGRAASKRPEQAQSSRRSVRSRAPAAKAASALYCEVDGLPVEIEPQELSTAGVFVETAMPLPVDSEVQVFVRIGDMRFESSGHVVHVVSCEQAKSQRRKPGYGLLFINVDEAARAALRQVIESLSAPAPPPTAAAIRFEPTAAAAPAKSARSDPAPPQRKARADGNAEAKYERRSVAHEAVALDPKHFERGSIAHKPVALDPKAFDRQAAAHEAVALDPKALERQAATHGTITSDSNTFERKSIVHPPIAPDSKTFERKSIAHEPIAPDFKPFERKSIAHEPIAPDFKPFERKSVAHTPVPSEPKSRERRSVVHEQAAPDSKARERRSAEPAAPAAVIVSSQERVLLDQLRAEQRALEGKTPWEVLGISQGADSNEVRRAFFDASKRYHPHLFARYRDPEIKRIVTELFIAHKRAYTSFERSSKGTR
jgi:hypothetical protein